MPGPNPVGGSQVSGTPDANESPGSAHLQTYPTGWQAVVSEVEKDIEVDATDDLSVPPPLHSSQDDDEQNVKKMVAEYRDAFQLQGAYAAHFPVRVLRCSE